MPAAEVEIHARLVKRLIAQQFSAVVDVAASQGVDRRMGQHPLPARPRARRADPPAPAGCGPRGDRTPLARPYCRPALSASARTHGTRTARRGLSLGMERLPVAARADGGIRPPAQRGHHGPPARDGPRGTAPGRTPRRARPPLRRWPLHRGPGRVRRSADRAVAGATGASAPRSGMGTRHLGTRVERPGSLAPRRPASGEPSRLAGSPARDPRFRGPVRRGPGGRPDQCLDVAPALLARPPSCRGARRPGHLGRGRGWALALGLAILERSSDNEILASVGRRGVVAVIEEVEMVGP